MYDTVDLRKPFVDLAMDEALLISLLSGLPDRTTVGDLVFDQV